jgi:glycosyltransferase involved in cell wall biosynthesis
MAASDLLIHPSLTEASNNVVKEMGVLEKGVAVCRNVGDFNDYIEEGRNGFFIDRDNLKQTVEKIIRIAYKDKEKLAVMGKELRKDVLRLFDDLPENRKRFTDLID